MVSSDPGGSKVRAGVIVRHKPTNDTGASSLLLADDSWVAMWHRDVRGNAVHLYLYENTGFHVSVVA